MRPEVARAGYYRPCEPQCESLPTSSGFQRRDLKERENTSDFGVFLA